MIKRITTLLNNKILVQPKGCRFTVAKQSQNAAEQIQQQQGQQIKQQLQATGQTQQLPQQTAQAIVQQTSQRQKRPFKTSQQMDQQQWSTINLFDSNWKQMAPLLHTNYYSNKNQLQLEDEVNDKLQGFQNIYGFDLMNLSQIKIQESTQFQLKRYAIAAQFQSNRYLENSISQNSRIGYGIMTMRKFNDLLKSKDLRALRYSYNNQQFSNFFIQYDQVLKILETVVQTNYQTHFILNFINFTKNPKFNKSTPVIPNKNFQKVLQNINNLNQLNKLRFFWNISYIFQKGIDYVNFNVVNHQLARIGFEGFNHIQSQKNNRFIYSSILGRQPMQKLIRFALNRYSKTFQQFVNFWGLFNLLISRLVNLTQINTTQPTHLNSIFQLIQTNLSNSKQVISQLIPQILFDSKNKVVFQIYRNHAKQWLSNRSQSKNIVLSTHSIFDQFINQKISSQQLIRVTYQPFDTSDKNFQLFQPIKTYIKTSTNRDKNQIKQDEILTQTKMIQHLIQGDYNFVLNYFLILYHTTLDKASYMVIRSIIHQANQNYQFDNDNVKALFILKQINKKCLQMSEPVSFRRQFLDTFKVIRGLSQNVQQKKMYKKDRRQFNNHDKNAQFLQQSHKYSRKRQQNKNSQDYSGQHMQRMRNKPKKYPQNGGSLFNKKNTNKQFFSTTQQISSKNNQKDSYSQYRQVVKDLTQSSTVIPQFKLVFDPKLNPKQFSLEVQKKSKEINQRNHKSLFAQNQIPLVGSGVNLIKYLFLQKPTQIVPKLDEKIRKRLQVSFVSEIGALEKDFSQYLENCRFNFALAPEVYIALLQQQKVNYVRKSYKTIVSHMIGYRNQITHPQIQLICQIAQKNRIGITLIEIYSLLVDNKMVIPKQSIYILCDTLQKFKKINNDIFMLTKKYCESINMPFEMNMLSSYTKSLLLEQQDQKIAQLCQILKSQLKPKPYKLRSNLSSEQNIKLQKQHRQVIKKQYNKILFQIVDMIVHNVGNKLPKVVSELFDQYEKTKTKLNSKQIAISLIVYCNNVEKYLSIIRSLKQNPHQITIDTFQCAIKALKLNIKQLQSHSEQTFNVTLFTHNFMLKQDQIISTLQLLKNLHTPTVFIKLLEYILRFNVTVNYQMKNSMYFIMNNTNDDFSKNTISGLLDFIFNQNREKQRQQYRKAQILQEQKAILLSNLDNKQLKISQPLDSQTILQKMDAPLKSDASKKIQKSKIVKQNVQKDLSKDVIIDTKTSSQTAKIATQQLKKQKVQKPGSVKAQKRNIRLVIQQDTLTLEPSERGNLKKSNLKKKLRNKSFNQFQQMYTQKQQVQQQVDPKTVKTAKGAKQSVKQKSKSKNVDKKKGK